MLPHFLKEYKMINRWKCASYGSQRAWESGGRAAGERRGSGGRGRRGRRDARRTGTGTRGNGNARERECGERGEGLCEFFRIFARINRPGEGMRPGGKVI